MPRNATTTVSGAVPEATHNNINRLGLEYNYVPQYNLDQANGHHVQNRDETNVAPAANVEALRIGFLNGTTYPPIVMTADHYTVDGNTRIAAARKANRHDHPAIVLTLAYENAPAEVQGLIRALAALLNVQHGQRLTPAEVRMHVRNMVSLGWQHEQVARMLSVSTRRVSDFAYALKAEEKLNRIDIDTSTWPQPRLTALGREADTLNNEPFRRIATLANEAGLTQVEIRRLAAAARAVGSDDLARMVLDSAEENYHPRVVQRGLTGGTGMTIAHQLRMRLGWITAREPGDLIERYGDSAESHVEAIRATIDILSRTLEAQAHFVRQEPMF